MIPTELPVSRRNALKGIGGTVGAAIGIGAGGVALTGGGAALSTSMQVGDVSVSTDTGDIDEVFVTPTSTIQWAGFDVPITKIRQLIEARLEAPDGTVLTPTHSATPQTGNGWWPIWRETPWLFTTTDPNGGGTPPDFNYRGDDAWFAQPSYATGFSVSGGGGPNDLPATTGSFEYPLIPSATPSGRESSDENIYVVSENAPMPDYPNEVGGIGETMESLLSGVSIGGGGNFYNGSYGTVAGALGADGTAVMDNGSDDSTKDTVVRLRLTTSLHTDYDFAENVDSTLDDRLSPLAMGAAPDVGYQFANTHATPYSELLTNAAAHPAVDVVESSFLVTAENVLSESGTASTMNSGGS